jgi:hypothetical protein
MKSKKWAFTVILILAWQLAFAQSDIFAPIRDAIKAGSAKEAVKSFNQSLDINLEGEIKTYSKTQSEFVLRDFFKKHPPTDFTIVHTGASKGGLQYAIGNMKSNNETYNVLIRVKQSGNSYLVHEISFVKE